MDPTLCQATTGGTWFGPAPTIVAVLLAVAWAVVLYLKIPVERLHHRLLAGACLVVTLSVLLGYVSEGGRVGGWLANGLESSQLPGFAFFLAFLAMLASWPLATDWFGVRIYSRWRAAQALRTAPVRGSVGRYQVRGGFMHDEASPVAAAAGASVVEREVVEEVVVARATGPAPAETADELAASATGSLAREAVAPPPEPDATLPDEEDVPWYARRRAPRPEREDDELAERREPPARESRPAAVEEPTEARWDAPWSSEPAAAEVDVDGDRDVVPWDAPPAPVEEAEEDEVVEETTDDTVTAEVVTEPSPEAEVEAEVEAAVSSEGTEPAEAATEATWDDGWGSEAAPEVAWEEPTDAPAPQVEDADDEAEESIVSETPDVSARADVDEIDATDDEQIEDEDEAEDEAEDEDEDVTELAASEDEVDLAADGDGDVEAPVVDAPPEEVRADGEPTVVAVSDAPAEDVAEETVEEVAEVTAEEIRDEAETSVEVAPAPPARRLSPEDALFEQAGDLVVSSQRASISFLQRSLGIGYFQAAKLLDRLQNEAVIGPYTGAVNREVLMSAGQWEDAKAS